jgi:Flp pilus assembly pilin Flp
MKTLLRLLGDERGTESAEWAMILGVIVLAAITAGLGAKPLMRSIYQRLVTDLTNANT